MPSRPAPAWRPPEDPAEVDGGYGPGSPSGWPPPAEPVTHGENGAAMSNGQLPSPGAAGYHQLAEEPVSAPAGSEGEDTQGFSAVPPQGFTSFGAVPPDDQDLYEEDGPSFDDEDDRHL